MKHYRYFISLLGAITLMTACDFLDVVPDDAPTIEDAFKNRAAAEKALFTCYSFLPDPTNPYDYPAYFTSHDEFEIGSMHWIVGTAAYAIANGQQNANSPKQNYWPTMYRAIRYCNIFLEGIGTPRDIPEYERKRWIAEVKFLKAYYHYWLVSLYGPVAIVDRNLDISTPTEETMVYREPVDECIDYIVNLLEEAAPDLPTTPPNPIQDDGRITQSVALGIRAKALVLAASPLFNGNSDYANWTDNRGRQLVSPTFSREKWERAAEALKEAIDTCHFAGHALYEFDKSKFTGSMAMDDEQAKAMTVRKAVTERWNPGQVWASTASFGQGKGSGLGAFPSYGNMQRALMAKVFSEDTRSEIGMMAASANMAELFYTSKGVPIEEDKSWPYADRYNFDIVKAGTFSGHFVGVNEITAKLNMEREPRFYGSLGFDRGYYELTTTTSNAGASFNMLKMRYGEPGNGSVTGYMVKKLVAFETSASQGQSTGPVYSGYNYRMPLLRLADLYLLYSEALNEVKDEPDDEVYKWIDKVRAVNGLEGVVNAWSQYSNYPDRPKYKADMREIIRKERLIELVFEGQRFWDMRRWKTAQQHWSQATYGWDNLGSKAEAYYVRKEVYPGRSVSFKEYLWPLSLNDLLVNRNLEQTFGW